MKYFQLLVLVAVALFSVCDEVTAQTLSAELKAEGGAQLAKAARERGNAVRGALLFPQQKLGCAGCHTRGGRDVLGPDLTAMDKDVTDEYLVESLLYPSQVIEKGFEAVVVTTKAGKVYTGRIVVESPDKLALRDASLRQGRISLSRDEIDKIATTQTSYMPEGLADLLENRQQFLDLARYTMEIRAARSKPETPRVATSPGGRLSQELQGLMLMDHFQCFACHRREVAQSMIPPKQAPDLAWASGRIDPSYIERFIDEPLKVKPGTTMPDMMASLNPAERAAAAREITHFLVSLGDKTFQRQSLDMTAADRGRELFHSVGCVACHSPGGEDGAERHPDSVPLGMLEQKLNLDGLVAFLENPHAARSSGRMPNMQLSHWEAVDIANYLLNRSSAHGGSETRFELDAALAERGRLKFTKLGCGQCHAAQERRSQRDYPQLVAEHSDQGCLSGTAGKWPRYGLDELQRTAIRAAIDRAPGELTDRQQISLTLATFKCTACHQRGALGGVSPERDEYFQTTNPNLGPQGRMPPRLTGVGAKLKPKWMRQVLVSGRTIRPYMKTRMPQYGIDNVAHLVDLFQRVDRLPDVTFAEFNDQKEARNTGHELAGTGGLNCIACHNFREKPAATMPGVDLTEMSERLQKEWFYQYMRDPQRLSPGTVMPSFWPGGRAIRKDILEGDPNRQLEALWQYLLDGRQARPPRGLIREPIELLATDEAVMLRRSYPGIGKRGIGVGYPAGVNLAFDAEQMRLSMIWKGKFADPASVWRSQGHGQVRPLGSDLIRFPAGPELDDAVNPWVVDQGRPPRHRFRGYTLDGLQRPTFMYRFDNVDVEDYPIDVRDEQSDASLIRRTLTFSSDKGRNDLAFRAAAGSSIQAEDDHTFLVDKALRIRIDVAHLGQIVDIPAGKQLRVPLEIGKGKSALILEYTW